MEEPNEKNGWITREAMEEFLGKKDNIGKLQNTIENDEFDEDNRHVKYLPRKIKNQIKRKAIVFIANCGMGISFLGTIFSLGLAISCDSACIALFEDIKSSSAVVEKLDEQEDEARVDFENGIISAEEYEGRLKEIASYENIIETAKQVNDKGMAKTISSFEENDKARENACVAAGVSNGVCAASLVTFLVANKDDKRYDVEKIVIE